MHRNGKKKKKVFQKLFKIFHGFRKELKIDAKRNGLVLLTKLIFVRTGR